MSNKHSDFELLRALQEELIDTLKERKSITSGYIPRTCCKGKIRRLRLQIQEVMLRIEQKCDSPYYRKDKESWE